MTIAEVVSSLAKERWTNPTEADIVLVAGVLLETARQAYSMEPSRDRRLDMEKAEAYYESLRSVQAGSQNDPQGQERLGLPHSDSGTWRKYYRGIH